MLINIETVELPEAFDSLDVRRLWPVHLGWPRMDKDFWCQSWSYMMRKHGAFILADRDEDLAIRGVIGGVVRRSPETRDLTGFEMVWSGPIALLRAFESECAKRGAKRVYVTTVSTAPDKLDRVLRARFGYKCSEVVYRKEL